MNMVACQDCRLDSLKFAVAPPSLRVITSSVISVVGYHRTVCYACESIHFKIVWRCDPYLTS